MDSLRAQGQAAHVPYQPSAHDAREARPAIGALVEQAELSRAVALSPSEREAQGNHLHGVLAHVGGLLSGSLGSLSGPSVGPLVSRCFPELGGHRSVFEATTASSADNSTAAQIKRGYRDAYQQANREQAIATRTASRLGPGDHALSNGDHVNVSTSQDGTTRVTTTSPDGTTKVVSFNSQRPDEVHVRKSRPDGSVDELDRKGTTVSRRHSSEATLIGGTHIDLSGQGSTSTTYSLDASGRPVRTTSANGGEDTTRTTVNDDGSTDSSTSLYRDPDGTMVYGTSHEPSLWEGGFPWDRREETPELPRLPRLDPKFPSDPGLPPAEPGGPFRPHLPGGPLLPGHAPTFPHGPRAPEHWPFPTFPPLEGGSIPASGMLPSPVRY